MALWPLGVRRGGARPRRQGESISSGGVYHLCPRALGKSVRAGTRFQQLVIVAAPKWPGVLRKALHEEVLQRVAVRGTT
jgi:protein required for attachment to host cells